MNLARAEQSVEKNWRQILFDVLTVVALTLAVLFPLAVYSVVTHHEANDARKAFIASCHGQNDVRAQTLGFIDNTVQRSVAATNATLASPTATADQKSTAQRNLAALRAVDADAHARLAPLSCTYPPATKGTP